jgi:ParB/RepB/Spo0J family partition protein
MKTTTKKPDAAPTLSAPATLSQVALAGGELRNIELDQLELMENYRRTTHAGRDAELEASIAEQGILQPLLVRPGRVDHETSLVLSWEVVAGGRRFRAAKAVGLKSAPCFVRVMDDRAAREAQLTENIQRDDVDPLVEADALHALSTEFGISLDDLRVRTGKSASWVRERIALAGLCEGARERYGRGEFSISHALEIARLGSTEAQEEALSKIDSCYQGKAFANMTVRDLRTELALLFHRRMQDASWDPEDATLLPSAGACASCPKRTANSRDLFGESPEDSCTDLACWKAKGEALGRRKVEELQRQGYHVLEGALAKKAVDKHGNAKPGFARLDRELSYGNSRSVEDVLGKHLPADQRAVVVVNGEPIEVVTREALDVAAKKARVKLPAERKAGGAGAGPSYAKQEAKRQAQRAEADAQRPFAVGAVLDILSEALKQTPAKDLVAPATKRFAEVLCDAITCTNHWDWDGCPGLRGETAAAVALGLVEREGLMLDHPHIESVPAKKARAAALKKLHAWADKADRAVVAWWLGQIADALLSSCGSSNAHLPFVELADRRFTPALFELHVATGVDVVKHLAAAKKAFLLSREPAKDAKPAAKQPAKKKGRA